MTDINDLTKNVEFLSYILEAEAELTHDKNIFVENTPAYNAFRSLRHALKIVTGDDNMGDCLGGQRVTDTRPDCSDVDYMNPSSTKYADLYDNGKKSPDHNIAGADKKIDIKGKSPETGDELSADQIRLHFGELTPDEVRLVSVAIDFGRQMPSGENDE